MPSEVVRRSESEPLGENNKVTKDVSEIFFVFVLKCNAIFRLCKAEVDMMLVFHHHTIMLATLRTVCRPF